MCLMLMWEILNVHVEILQEVKVLIIYKSYKRIKGSNKGIQDLVFYDYSCLDKHKNVF